MSLRPTKKQEEESLRRSLEYQRSLRESFQVENAELHNKIAGLAADNLRLIEEVKRLKSIINTPRTDEYFEAVRNEAAHQIERWGVEHDAGKRPEDWIALLTYLTGKATKAHYDNDLDKLKHHVVTVGAVCLNWLRNINGENTLMRPGIG